ncbi:tetratricopeptide repeat protein [Enterobacter roggenkampii]|jgi:TPR repeat protein|uniref:Sel1 domain-containing protein n=1 Tax=Enterobacter roggenkampii TaxID=1812935 RepID=A0ABD7KBS7_9ENTR|nr:tetratricopeptide repeat protein [Enterobacter roggenkampii]RWS72973.1 sel1 repeat family protein [Enterobacter cloacae]MCB7499523.1 sel1 repeat family protein [Enterobacter roggenkampii]MCE5965754.1 sel1 repeat family protein [Enterobacter roggenkampii]MCE5970186.1 sel1 repeat family protein [Enterobacter roggenkampii]UHY21905.1 sel1 repeat family protein [Enterobacter roggenkampii]
MKRITSLLGIVFLAGCSSSHVDPVKSSPHALLNDFNQQVAAVHAQAERGDVQSQQRSGTWLLSAGKEALAEPLLRAAADKHQPEAQFQLGKLLLEQRSAEGRRWLEASADQGNVSAQRLLARYHRSGPLVTDPKQAFHWLLMAAQQGDAQAQNDVGAAYTQGTGVKKDVRQAFTWYSKSAKQGNALAQFNLAGAYQAGEGVPAQPELAFAWYNAAVNNSRDERLKRTAENMKLRMYAEASRQGKALKARQLAEQLLVNNATSWSAE